MNLLLFDTSDSEFSLPIGDVRAIHIRTVLRMSVGDRFDVGVVNGPRGKATIVADDADGMRLSIEWGAVPALPMAVSLIVGLPRPQTARKVLRECTSIGAASIAFFASGRGEPSYRASRLWTTDEWRRHLREGAEQAFTTHVPVVTHHDSLVSAIAESPGDSQRIALDVYEATVGLGAIVRGWSRERDLGGADCDSFTDGNRAAESRVCCDGGGFSDQGESTDDPEAAQAEARGSRAGAEHGATSGSAEIARAEACGSGVVLAVGPERGWSGAERAVLRDSDFTLAHLGDRVLRTETACTSAIAMIAVGRRWL